MTAAIVEHANNALEGVVHTNAERVKFATTTNAVLLYARTTMNAIKDACVMMASALMLNACMIFTAGNAAHALIPYASQTTTNAVYASIARQMDMNACPSLVAWKQAHAQQAVSVQADHARDIYRLLGRRAVRIET